MNDPQQAISEVESAPLPLVVGIGGSAGGLQATLALLETVDPDIDAALIVVLHLSPAHESHAAEVMQRATAMPVRQVTSRMRLEAGHVYVIAPGTDLITNDGHVQPSQASSKRPSSVIDLFFRSLATVHRERAVAIVLSGTGRDGSLGLASVREYGGFTMAQEPESSEHDDMPKAAMATGAVDQVMAPSQIGKRLLELTRFPRPAVSGVPWSHAETETQEASGDSDERAFREVLNALRTRTRHDFQNYKRATIWRRLERRMQVNGLDSVQAYRDHVRSHPEELGPLLADMLISVTNFFRDPEAFDALQKVVLPSLMESIPEGEDLRVWVTACASGEEAYSIAILLQEHADRMLRPPRIQMFASDISDVALNTARGGLYPPNIATDVSESRLLGYFDKEKGNHYRVRPAVRQMIVFARHNVLSDPPFSRLDFICCRNLLIYLDRTAQAAALEVFSYALKPGGYLFLGSAESVDSLSTAFETVDKEHRVYRLRLDADSTVRPRVPSQLVHNATSSPVGAAKAREAYALEEQPLARLHELALAAASPPSVLINAQFEIERVSPGAGRFVGFAEGIPTRSLLNNVAPDIRVELRTALFRAGESGQSVRTVFRRDDGNGAPGGPGMALSIHPLAGVAGAPARWLVLFDEPTPGSFDLLQGAVGDDVQQSSAVRRLEDENRSLKLLLQETLDGSAASSEELKASNEELQAINEELRSAKEELETSKEELQSINEELSTVNFELRMKVEEAGRNNDDLQNLIEASAIATVFVDSAMTVKRFTPQAAKLFSLIESDVGRPLMDVKNRLRYDELVPDATSVFKSLRPVERAIDSIDGDHFLARILPYRTSMDKIGGAVLTFVDVTDLRRAQDNVRLSEERLRDAIAISKDFAVITMDRDGVVTTWNDGAARMFAYEQADIVGKPVDILFVPEDRAADAPAQERREALRTGRSSDERWHLRSDGSVFYCSGVVTPLQGRTGFLKIARDTSSTKELEQRQRLSLNDERSHNADIAHASELKDRFLAVMSHELKQPLNLIHVNAELLVRLPEAKTVPSVQRIGDTILRAVAAQETIVNDLLDLSRVQTGKLRLHREATDLADIVRRFAQAMAEDAARKKIALHVELAEQVVCDCDRVRVEQIIWNLLGNALKFTPENGRINVRLGVEGVCAKLEVADTGLGIAAESLPIVFELFSQAAAAESVGAHRGGLGIGLALVRELAHAHGGRVEATSAGPGKGATFTVWLPLAKQEVLTTPVVLSEALHQRILMVDDDADALEVFAELLTLEGASVHKTTSASEALKMLAADKYDVLLSDIGMPEMSGLEFMRRARAIPLKRRVTSIAISGYGRDVDERAALDAGFDAHLCKPISLERLTTALERLRSGH